MTSPSSSSSSSSPSSSPEPANGEIAAITDDPFCILASLEADALFDGLGEAYRTIAAGEPKTSSPSNAPSNAPSDAPSNAPSDAPSDAPSEALLDRVYAAAPSMRVVEEEGFVAVVAIGPTADDLRAWIAARSTSPPTASAFDESVDSADP